MVEALARIDSAVAWNINVAGSATLTVARLRPGGIEQILGDRSTPPIFASAASPRCSATPVDGGMCVSGEVHFVSGCEDADWIHLFAEVEPDPESSGETAPAPGCPRGFRSPSRREGDGHVARHGNARYGLV